MIREAGGMEFNTLTLNPKDHRRDPQAQRGSERFSSRHSWLIHTIQSLGLTVQLTGQAVGPKIRDDGPPTPSSFIKGSEGM
jgi:hypothetical protein